MGGHLQISCDKPTRSRRRRPSAPWEALSPNTIYIYNTRSSPMSSLFLTELPPISLCAHLLVLTFRTTAGYYTHVSELSS